MKRAWLILLLSGIAFAQGSQVTTFTGTGSGRSVKLVGAGIMHHQLVWNTVGTVSACTVVVDGSADGTTWGNGDVVASQTCTASGFSAVADITVNYVRVRVVTWTGTGSVAVRWFGSGGVGGPLGYNAENTANKSTSTSLGTSDLLYPTQKAVKNYVDTHSIAGSNTQVLFNDGGVLGGDAGLTWDKTSKTLGVIGIQEIDMDNTDISAGNEALLSIAHYTGNSDISNVLNTRIDTLNMSANAVNTLTGLQINSGTASTGVVLEDTALAILSPSLTAAVTQQYGIRISDQHGANATAATALQIDDQGSNDYAIKVDGGKVNLSASSVSTGNLTVTGTVGATGALNAGGGSANKVVCWKADAKTLGYCSTQPDADGACTCN